MKFPYLLGALVLAACNSTPDVPVDPNAPVQPATLAGAVELVDAPASGDVKIVVRDAMIAAAKRQHRLVVYVGATWCEPCERFREAAKRGELNAKFPGLALLVFDADRDRQRLKDAGYTSTYIPLLVLPKPDGSASEWKMEGGEKGYGAVAQMAPRLTTLLSH